MFWTIEHREKEIRIAIDPNLLFERGSATLTSRAEESVRELTTVLGKLSGTQVVIEGHDRPTENVGQGHRLSRQRIDLVSKLFKDIAFQNSKGY